MADILDIQQIPRSRSRSRSPGGASHSSAQTSFLRIFGFITDLEEIEIERTDILSQDICEDIALALQHKSYHEHPLAKEKPSRDSTFTKEEFDSYQTSSYELLSKFSTVGDPQQLRLLQEEFTKLKEKGCQCPLHLRLDSMQSQSIPPDDIVNLVDTPSSLTNYWGVMVMSIVFPLVSQASGLEMDIQEVSAGSPVAVSFEVTSTLKTRTSPRRRQTTTKQYFEGSPDVAIWRRRCGRMRRKIRGLGEVQSKPGSQRWQDSMAQVGIYSLGNMHQNGLSRLVNIVLTKDKGALVLAMTHNDKWTYKFVESMVPYDLKTASGVQQFANVMVSALKWANVED